MACSPTCRTVQRQARCRSGRRLSPKRDRPPVLERWPRSNHRETLCLNPTALNRSRSPARSSATLAKKLLREGNVRQVIVNHEHTVAKFPLTVGVIGAVVAPVLAAVGDIAVLLMESTVEVERVADVQTKEKRPLE
jgi:hypothetical protein